MASLLPTHRPSPLARRRAAAAGLDLDELKRSDPEQYMMLNAEEVLRVDSALAPVAGAAFFELRPDHALFQLPDAAPQRLRLLAFPGLDRSAIADLEERLAEVAASREADLGLIVFRVIRDASGTWREFVRPLAASAWAGERALVGPFADEASARSWAEQTLDAVAVSFDVLAHAGVWLCDVFELPDPAGG